jgi:hypothetical protein
VSKEVNSEKRESAAITLSLVVVLAASAIIFETTKLKLEYPRDVACAAVAFPLAWTAGFFIFNSLLRRAGWC